MARLDFASPQLEQNAKWCLDVARYYGIDPVVTSTWRSLEKQAALRSAWERGESRWPANRPGDSAHNFGLAWDSWVPEWAWPLWTKIRVFAGWRVPPNDKIHAEVPGWRRFRQ